jgi:pentapeptide MXKDX repeat protein
MTNRLMVTLSAATLCFGLALAPAFAADDMAKPGDAMKKTDSMSKTDTMSKDTMSKDTMSKDGMKKSDGMSDKKDGMSDPMKK